MNLKSKIAGSVLMPAWRRDARKYSKGNVAVTGYSRFVHGGMVACALLFSINAQAVLISAGDNFSDPTYLSGGTYTGTFDINALMNSTFGGQSYTINSGYINFGFTDDSNDTYYNGTNTSTYGSYTSGYSYYQYAQYYNPYESVTVSVGGQSQSATPGYSSSTAYNGYSTSGHWVSQGYTSYYSCGLFGWSTCSYWVDTSYYVTDYYYNYTTTSGYAINSAFSLGLDGTAISDLSLDGILNYNLNVSGDLMFNYANLVIDASMISSPGSSAVPEPGSLALLGLGLIGLLGMRQKKRI